MTENKETIMKRAEEVVLHTYNRYPLVLERERAFICMIRRGSNIWTLRRGSPYKGLAIITPVTTKP